MMRSLLLAVVMAVSVPAAATPQAGGARLTPQATSFFNNFSGMKLIDQDGRQVALRRLSGRVVLVNFVYTGCSTICPVQTRALADLQRQLPEPLRRQVHFLSISLDPLTDTPQTLKAFSQRMGADLKRWSFVTGKPEDMERVADQLRLFRPGPDTKRPDDHSTALWLIDAQGQLRMRYAGNPPDIPRLLREISVVQQLPTP
jgi:cytochrome oxidase Cu insertion factor (SCO1/SenC/PrrC family)